MTRLQARRIALVAQGFGGRRPQVVTQQHLRRAAEQLGVIQIDSVNVVARSHYLPFHARLGDYDRALLDGLRDGRSPSGRRAPHHLVEYWAHEASLVTPATWPLLGFRMRRAQDESWSGMQAVMRDNPELVRRVEGAVRAHGPVTARELERILDEAQVGAREHWGWNWSETKRALEHLFWAGQVTSAGRTSQFERRYAAPEDVLPADQLALAPQGQHPVPEDEAVLELVRLSARAHGIGTERCLRDYVRLPVARARPAIDHLLAAGELETVDVPGWKGPVYLWAGARRPTRPVEATALLSPFDSLIWQRERTSALWGMDYRIEIYTPEPQRVFGYYVLPFLWRESLVARVDLRADRAAGVLRAPRVTLEPELPDAGAALSALREQLSRTSAWLGLDAVEVGEIRTLA